MNPLVVIIPSRSAANLAASIPAVVKREPEAKIIIVDDGINSEATLPFGYPNISSIQGIQPFVFSRNINIGMRAAGESDVVLLNDDAILETQGGFSLMQRCAADNPEVGIIGAVTNLTGQPLQRPLRPACPNEATHRMNYSTYVFDNHWWKCSECSTEVAFGHRDPLRKVEHIAFVCVLIPWRTRRFLANDVGMQDGFPFTGGFLDERYSAGYGSEDLDYCMQVRHAGLKVCVHDGCYVDHGSLHSSFRGLPTAAGDIWPNHRILRKKWGLVPEYHPSDPEGHK